MSSELRIDEIGYWSEVKLSILEEYASPYNLILRSKNFHPIYIDAFAGAGHHKAKDSDRLIEGSPTRAMSVEPPFESLHFIDSDIERVKRLKQLASDRRNVTVHHGDCNDVLVSKIFPTISYANRQRALCILDPYGLHLNWEIMRLAGESKVIEIFLNFPVMDMNMNVFWHDYQGVSPTQQERMTKFWGDDSWKEAAYETVPGLFGDMFERTSNDIVAEAFRKRLKTVARFEYVPAPMPMRNSKGATVYYLFFAAQKAPADKIVRDIFRKYEHYGEDENG